MATKRAARRTVPVLVEMHSDVASFAIRRESAREWKVEANSAHVATFGSLVSARRWCRSAGAKPLRIVRERIETKRRERSLASELHS